MYYARLSAFISSIFQALASNPPDADDADEYQRIGNKERADCPISKNHRTKDRPFRAMLLHRWLLDSVVKGVAYVRVRRLSNLGVQGVSQEIRGT